MGLKDEIEAYARETAHSGDPEATACRETEINFDPGNRHAKAVIHP